jgi:hypothetical protein
MTTWSRTTARQAGFGVAATQSVRRNLKGSQRRILLVYPEPLVEANGTKLMHVMEAGTYIEGLFFSMGHSYWSIACARRLVDTHFLYLHFML